MEKKLPTPVFPQISVPQVSEKGLPELILDVQKRLKIQLTNYKQDYIKRRLLSRMNSTRSKDFAEYHQYLRTHPEEEEKLRNALTINVTKFFRDLEVFDLVKKEIFPTILKDKRSIKIWSAGCSSGEEPYTYAIILYELGKTGPAFNGSIIASDIDEEMLKRARLGAYEKNALENMTETQIAKHFDKKEDGKYYVKDHIKQVVRFQAHDLMTAGPVSRMMDMVSCRNVTIYFNEQQKKDLVKLVHESLGKDGFYIMGMSEYMAKDVEHLFKPYKPMLKVFQKVEQ
ncbi:CheR family methyltransferase [Methanospirillum lacunae]|uniref:protein-glutamate O-methyltransferase n=1 Tax=Methanospirillum lacunae TaxID=668570 RepID=A0A2V2N0N2_9EURY|nr:protein-glutamate O-methyltransferase CheR [Methanospirillum lacunae]PWR73914.1 chemotaxis protein CheR [Methanospirillum lacunae]